MESGLSPRLRSSRLGFRARPAPRAFRSMAWLQAPSIWGWSGAKCAGRQSTEQPQKLRSGPWGKRPVVSSAGRGRPGQFGRRLCCFQQTEPACLFSVRPQELYRASLSFPKLLIIIFYPMQGPLGAAFARSLCACGCSRAQPEILRPKPGNGFPFDLWAEVSRKPRPGPQRGKRNSERSQLFSF